MSKLFSPLQIGNVTLPNRITVAPMCQYSAIDGSMTDWHLMHLGNLALSGASMLVIEATGVAPEGRITPQCTGLYSDANEEAMVRVVKSVRNISPIVLGIQLGHAGRKASAHRPWNGRGALKPGEGADDERDNQRVDCGRRHLDLRLGCRDFDPAVGSGIAVTA